MKKEKQQNKKRPLTKHWKKILKVIWIPLILKACLHAKHFCLEPLTKINKESKVQKDTKDFDVIGSQQNLTKREKPKK